MWPKLNTMKHFVTLAALMTSLIALAQNPNYDPDSNGDDLIGAEDLVSLLGVYNTSLAVDTTLECDFEGTAEDEWLFGVFTGEVVIDSVVVQFSISDSATYYEPGCPTEKVYFLDVEWEYVLPSYEAYPTFISFGNTYTAPWGSGWASMGVGFDSNNGRAWVYWYDYNLGSLRSNTAPFGADFHFPMDASSMYACINVSEWYHTFDLTSDGIVGGRYCNEEEGQNGPFNSPFYNYFRLLPYWHYAE